MKNEAIVTDNKRSVLFTFTEIKFNDISKINEKYNEILIMRSIVTKSH